MTQLKRTPAVAILGPRQIGKTTLARQIAKEWPSESVYLDLERPSDLAKIKDPELYLKQHFGKLVVIDEIQRMPDLFKVLRAVIDERRADGEEAGQFLLLGSASLDLVQGASESLAGRISYIDLGGLDASEIGKKYSLDALWLRGGFPKSFLAASDEESFIWREDFIGSYLERDIPSLGPRVPAETLRLFWTMLAHSQGQVINQSKIAGNIGVSVPTVRRYLDLLTDLLLIRPLRPWAGNIGKRLVKSPKYYIRDSGITHALLGIQTMDELMGHPVIGKSWEGFVIENLLAVAPRRTVPLFFETSSHSEIDLVLETGSKNRIAIEVKRSLSPALSAGFYGACKDLEIRDIYVVYPGEDSFPLSKDVKVVPLKKMMDVVLA